MNTQLLTVLLLVIFAWPALADDAADVRAAIEQHYAAINSGDEETVYGHHLPGFTMYGADGGVLMEADAWETAERMKATLEWTPPNVRMANFSAQVFDDVAVATFYLVGTAEFNGESMNVNNRVSAVWVKRGNEWKEAHHHESRLGLP